MKPTSQMSVPAVLFCCLLMASPFSSNGQPGMAGIEQSAAATRSRIGNFEKTVRDQGPDGQSIVYTENGQLRLVALTAIEPSTEKHVEWFFEEGLLTYCETKWIDRASGMSVYSEKLWFHRGRLAQWWNSRDKEIDPSSVEFMEMDGRMEEYGRKLAAEAQK